MSVWWVVPPTSSATVSGKSGASRAPVFTGGGSDARSRRARRPVGPLTGMLQPDSPFAKTDLIGPRASLAGRRILQVELRHGSGHDEIAVVKAERARNAVLVELEADSVGRGLFAGLRGALLEIADGDGPALETGQRCIAGCSIVRQFLARRDGIADHRKGREHLVAGFRAVEHRQLKQGLAGLRRLDDAPDMLSREYDLCVEIEVLRLRLYKLDRHPGAVATSAAVDGIDDVFIDLVFGVEAKRFGVAVFPGGGPQIAHRHLAPAAVDPRHLAELQCVAFTGAAGEIIKNASTHRLDGSLAMRLQKLEVVDGAMRRERYPCRSRRRGGKAGPRHQRGCNHLQSDLHAHP